MQTITGLYDNYDDARAVVNTLEDAGISSANISIVGRDSKTGETYAGEGAATGAGLGAVVGGAGGLLAGLGMLAIPGVGPVVAAGWLVSTVAGAAAGAVAGGAAGGIIGSLTDTGVDEDQAHVYAEGLRRGSTLVSVRVDEDQADLARAIINESTPVDIEARRAMYREEGWERFDETSPGFTDDEVAKERKRLREYRQQMP
ncbi:general stress protein [Phyllobacterium zundukense]|uniref:General stress protein 17M-like domain-containing protein n=1 Tax=Phyllobacterium zundukense TaxID=1867719 RepID=A0A2N9W171_9HYPH|nr:general stress protein [Phyllobacterium zundukense]ATU94587.1 hypothetical protein BLM14_22655 [Phyllobacterium zundukense]PIO45489.1 hypothetical protein B5P45_07310 [Phyllobacterium zundukense]